MGKITYLCLCRWAVLHSSRQEQLQACSSWLKHWKGGAHSPGLGRRLAASSPSWLASYLAAWRLGSARLGGGHRRRLPLLTAQGSLLTSAQSPVQRCCAKLAPAPWLPLAETEEIRRTTN